MTPIEQLVKLAEDFHKETGMHLTSVSLDWSDYANRYRFVPESLRARWAPANTSGGVEGFQLHVAGRWLLVTPSFSAKVTF